MDKRCPRKLNTPPKEFCPMAVARLKWRAQWQPKKIKGKWQTEPSEEEENNAPGCPWAVNSHDASFCFFKAYSEDREKLTDSQIAHMLGVSEPTVKKTADRAIQKAAQDPVLKEVKEYYGSESVVQERLLDVYEDQLNDLSGLSVSTMTDDEPAKSDEEL
jgi:hypothetical protein